MTQRNSTWFAVKIAEQFWTGHRDGLANICGAPASNVVPDAAAGCRGDRGERGLRPTSGSSLQPACGTQRWGQICSETLQIESLSVRWLYCKSFSCETNSHHDIIENMLGTGSLWSALQKWVSEKGRTWGTQSALCTSESQQNQYFFLMMCSPLWHSGHHPVSV